MVNRHRFVEENCTRILYENVGSPKEKKVLDVGCGKTEYSLIFVANGNEYYGVDLDVKRKRLHTEENLIQADATHLPFRDKQFDVVFSQDLLHHIEHDPATVVTEMNRVGNRFVIIESNRYVPYLIWACYYGHNHFSPQEFKNIIRKSLKIEPKIRFIGVYAKDPNFSAIQGVRRAISSIAFNVRSFLKREGKLSHVMLAIVFSPTSLFDSLLSFLTMFSSDFFFSSRLFANSQLGFHMIFDSHTDCNSINGE